MLVRLQGPSAGPRRRLVVGLAVSLLSIALTTLLLYPLREVAPAVSLGVVYLLGVLLVSSIWGLWLGLATAVGSALAFNFFHIPPTGRLTIAEGEHVVAFGVFFVAAVVAAELAQRARLRAAEAEERRGEADLAAEMARVLLLGSEDLRDALAASAQRLAAALALPSAAIRLGAVEADEGRLTFPLRDGPHQLGTLLVPAATDEPTLRRLQERVVPSLEALLGAAIERDELLGNRVEAAALRRTDVLKTALLRAVSHDLRSPLTAIRTAAEPLRSGSLSATEREELAGVVIEESERLSRLIDNLLDLSRLEAGAAEAQLAACDLGEVIRAAVDELRADAGEFRLQLPDLPLLEADAAQLQRAFVNLLENSGRHSAGHPVLVRAQALHDRVPGARRRSRPRDPAGPARPSLRALLSQRHRCHRAPGVGAGPGDRARLRRGQRRTSMGGVAPQPGHHLRARVPAPGRRARERIDSPGRSRRLLVTEPRQRVLVCDDEAQILRALRVLLRDAGFDVLPASTASEALGHRGGAGAGRRHRRPGAARR